VRSRIRASPSSGSRGWAAPEPSAVSWISEEVRLIALSGVSCSCGATRAGSSWEPPHRLGRRAEETTTPPPQLRSGPPPRSEAGAQPRSTRICLAPPPRTSSAASDAAGSIGPLTSPPRDGNGDPIPNSPRGIRPLGDGDASILISHGELFGEKLIPVGYGGGGDVPALLVPVSPQPRLKRPGPIKNSP
jgi:hypothetical protein